MTRIHRHKTAMVRADLSRPVRVALEAGLIDKRRAFFDFGCGRMDDVLKLKQIGIKATGWDPVHCPKGQKRRTSVVNLGYVVNVIEDPIERLETLRSAWALASRLLIVSARLSQEAQGMKLKPHGDGYLTQKNTFQKFYEQAELRQWIDGALDVHSVAAAPGIFFVFRSEEQKQAYVASRYRAARVAIELPRADELYAQYEKQLRPLIDFIVERGRLPLDEEEAAFASACETFGSVHKACAVIRQACPEALENAGQQARDDLLVFLALSRFGGRPRFSSLPKATQFDAKALFGSYKEACAQADELLFAVGKQENIDQACRRAPFGKLTPEALYVHHCGVVQLSPLLRVYEGCARVLSGDVDQVNVVKLSRRKASVSYLVYEDFDEVPHPALLESIAVSFSKLRMRFFDYRDRENPPIIHRKELFVPLGYPKREVFSQLTADEESNGLYEMSRSIGSRSGWEQRLEDHGLVVGLDHKLRSRDH